MKNFAHTVSWILTFIFVNIGIYFVVQAESLIFILVLFFASWLFKSLTHIVIFALLNLIFNKARGISYSSFSQCLSFFSWLSYDWDFYSNGRKTGSRFMGLEVEWRIS